MNVGLVVVGRVSGHLEPGVREYEKRAGRYWRLRIREVDEEPGSSGAGPQRVREREGERILRAIPDQAIVLLLTRTGKGLSSEGLARYLERQQVASRREVCFVIGGAHGVAPAVEAESTFGLSLSPMTLPHELARLVLAEQLYRAGTIVRGEPYHKGADGGGRAPGGMHG